MTGFLDIVKFEFKKEQLEKAYAFLGHAGEDRFEAVALFAGDVDGNIATIREVILPEQKSYKLESGLMYVVDGDELHRINVWLYKNRLRLIAQIHSHPEEAYHSETDDEFPIISTVGGLSIVIPFFARQKIDYDEWAYYRLGADLIWNEFNHKDLINVV